jgi:hypothetical protein
MRIRASVFTLLAGIAFAGAAAGAAREEAACLPQAKC